MTLSVVRRPPTIELVIPGQPVPASRVRVPGRGRPFYEARYRNWKNEAFWMISKAVMRRPGGAPGWIGFVAVDVTFYGANDTADIDNLVKASLDAIQAGGIIANDRQVTDLTARRRRAPKEEHCTIIKVTPLDPLEQLEGEG